jgi:hypothetical protein
MAAGTMKNTLCTANTAADSTRIDMMPKWYLVEPWPNNGATKRLCLRSLVMMAVVIPTFNSIVKIP